MGEIAMADALSIALTGLMAQKTRLDATASNIANADTEGALPTPQAPATTVYKPLQVGFSTQAEGGVTATVTANEQGFSPVSNPGSPYANAEGLVAAPNVDLNQEMVNLIEARLAFKGNIQTVKAADKMMGDLLDIVT